MAHHAHPSQPQGSRIPCHVRQVVVPLGEDKITTKRIITAGGQLLYLWIFKPANKIDRCRCQSHRARLRNILFHQFVEAGGESRMKGMKGLGSAGWLQLPFQKAPTEVTLIPGLNSIQFHLPPSACVACSLRPCSI